jgi:hypothetical protein
VQEVANHDDGATAQDDQDANRGIQIFVRGSLVVRLHKQCDLRDNKAKPDDGDAGPKPGQERAVIGELVVAHAPLVVVSLEGAHAAGLSDAYCPFCCVPRW